MSFGQTSGPTLGTALFSTARLSFPFRKAHDLCTWHCPARRATARSWCAAGQASPSGGFMRFAGITSLPTPQHTPGRGQGGGRARVWNTLRRPRGQLVNFVGMHLVERRCINIRSLSVYCVSRSGGGGGPVGHRCLSSSRQRWLVGVLRRSLLAPGQS